MMVHQNDLLMQMLRILWKLDVIKHLNVEVGYAPFDPMGYYDVMDHTNPPLDVTIRR